MNEGIKRARGGGGGSLCGGLYWEAPPERGTFFSLQVYERVGISLVKEYKSVREIFLLFCKRVQKG